MAQKSDGQKGEGRGERVILVSDLLRHKHTICNLTSFPVVTAVACLTYFPVVTAVTCLTSFPVVTAVTYCASKLHVHRRLIISGKNKSIFSFTPKPATPSANNAL